jgi:RNA polymerase sigma-70 factor (ECF subfamily)
MPTTDPAVFTSLNPTDDLASDAEVIEAVLAGATDRFEVLLRRYNQRLFRVARAILRDDAEAEDAVQQAYLAAFTALPQLGDRQRFAAWMTRITVREALRRRGRPLQLAIVDDSDTDPELSIKGPEERAASRELRDTLEAAIDSLPDAYRTVLIMRDVQELSTRETAEALDTSEESVRVRLHRARRALKLLLEERCGVALADVFSFAGARCDRICAAVMNSLR